MKTKILSLIITFIALLSFNNAYAQNLVEKTPPYAIDLGDDLSVCIDFAGLGNMSNVNVTVTYTAEVATYCINRGQQKQDEDPVPGLTRTFPDQTVPVNFRVHNGRARGCQTIETNFPAGDCPSSNMRSDIDVTFKNVRLTILGHTYNLGDITPVQ